MLVQSHPTSQFVKFGLGKFQFSNCPPITVEFCNWKQLKFTQAVTDETFQELKSWLKTDCSPSEKVKSRKIRR